MDEADQLADHIAVIDRGKLIAEGTSDELKTHLGGDVVEFALDKESDVQAALKAVAKLSNQKPTVDEDGLTITVPVKNGSKGLLKVVEELNKVKISPASLSLHRPSLDDVFLALTGKKAVSTIKPEEKKKGRK
jgi:ABC-2 type transport system ATP-binding protein